jgi:hypothetical protein
MASTRHGLKPRSTESEDAQVDVRFPTGEPTNDVVVEVLVGRESQHRSG